jgi:uncharacterized membrane protein YeaQ/YmgE (transglycosylase-associated protein family)
MNFILFLLIGAIAGWLAGKIMKGRGFGILGNMVVGIVGAFIGGFLFRAVGLAAYGLIGSLITATVGAVVLLFLIGLVKKNS